MAWKELLNQEGKKNHPAENGNAAPRDRGGLIGQISKETVSSSDDNGSQKPGGEEEHIRLPDGYLRRTPVQEYRTSPDFKKKRIRRAVLAVVVVCLLALLVLAVLKSGLIKLK